MKKGKDYSPFQGKQIDFKEGKQMNTITCATQKDNLIIQMKDEWDISKKETWRYEITCNCGNIFIGILSDVCPKCKTHNAAYTNEIVQVKSATKEGFEIATEGDSINLSMPNSKTRRGRVGVGVAQTLDTQANQSVLLSGNIRRLTEIECERLQGYKDNHTEYGLYPVKKVSQAQMNKMSNDELISLFETGALIKKKVPRTQRYKLCGNAVTVDVVEMVGVKLFN